MSMNIRPAGPTDLRAVVEFNWRLAHESEGLILDRNVLTAGVRAAIDDPQKGPYVLACDGDAVLGQLAVTREWSDWRNGWFWWLQSVYVVPEARGRGVFRILYDHVCTLAREAGNVVGIKLYVDRDNARGHAAYRSVGMILSHYQMYESSIAPLQPRDSDPATSPANSS